MIGLRKGGRRITPKCVRGKGNGLGLCAHTLLGGRGSHAAIVRPLNDNNDPHNLFYTPTIYTERRYASTITSRRTDSGDADGDGCKTVGGGGGAGAGAGASTAAAGAEDTDGGDAGGEVGASEDASEDARAGTGTGAGAGAGTGAGARSNTGRGAGGNESRSTSGYIRRGIGRSGNHGHHLPHQNEPWSWPYG